MEDNKKVVLGASIAILLIIGFVCLFLNFQKMEKVSENITTTKKTTTVKTRRVEPENIVYRNGNLVLSLEDKFKKDAVWCGTFNIIWNDLRDELAKKDIEWIMYPKDSILNNLNKGTFTTKELSNNSYYKKIGRPSLELKKEIEKAIKDKFNQNSDVLDEFNWEEADPENDWFLYAMLYKEFEFEKEFDKIGKRSFNNSEEKYEYFGINLETNGEVFNNIKLLWYKDKDHFIAELLTKGNDELLIYKGYTEDNFLDAYNKIKEEESKNNYYGYGRSGDTFMMPNLKTNIIEEITEVENKDFLFSNGDSYHIEKALQTVKFELNNKGGKVKSEAAIITYKNTSIGDPEEPNIHLDVDKDFMLFIREKGSNLPYLALNIKDMSLYK